MMVFFYIPGIIAILSTICVIMHYNPIHALLYLIISLLSISCIFFLLGSSFAGAVEVIVYAGAIMILFVFVIMMLNTNTIISDDIRERRFLAHELCCGVVLSVGTLLFILLYTICIGTQNCYINMFTSVITLKKIGVILFGPYMIIVEMASFLLLSSLIVILHLTQEHKLMKKYTSNQL